MAKVVNRAKLSANAKARKRDANGRFMYEGGTKKKSSSKKKATTPKATSEKPKATRAKKTTVKPDKTTVEANMLVIDELIPQAPKGAKKRLAYKAAQKEKEKSSKKVDISKGLGYLKKVPNIPEIPMPLPTATTEKKVEPKAKKTTTKAKKTTKTEPKTAYRKKVDDGQMLKEYGGTVKTEGVAKDSSVKAFDEGKINASPALVVNGKAIGKTSEDMIASVNASTNPKARAWTLQVFDTPEDVKSAQSLSVPDKSPDKFLGAISVAQKLRNVGEYLNLFSSEVEAGEGKHSGTKAQVKQAAKDLKEADRNWVPVLVRAKGKGYEVVGNHFAYEASILAGLERIWTILVDSDE